MINIFFKRNSFTNEGSLVTNLNVDDLLKQIEELEQTNSKNFDFCIKVNSIRNFTYFEDPDIEGLFLNVGNDSFRFYNVFVFSKMEEEGKDLIEHNVLILKNDLIEFLEKLEKIFDCFGDHRINGVTSIARAKLA